MSQPAKHIARDEHKFYCGRVNHHGACFTSYEHYYKSTSWQRRGICLSCVTYAAHEALRDGRWDALCREAREEATGK